MDPDAGNAPLKPTQGLSGPPAYETFSLAGHRTAYALFLSATHRNRSAARLAGGRLCGPTAALSKTAGRFRGRPGDPRFHAQEPGRQRFQALRSARPLGPALLLPRLLVTLLHDRTARVRAAEQRV